MIFSESLKKNRDFQKVYQNGKSKANKYLIYIISKMDPKGIVLEFPPARRWETVLYVTVCAG